MYVAGRAGEVRESEARAPAAGEVTVPAPGP